MAGKKQKKKDLNKLKDLISSIDENKREFAEKLLNRATFMDNTLDELEEIIENEGAVITTTNGNGFDVMSEHPAQKSYNIMIGKYNALIKTIIDLLPKSDSEGDELLDFLGSGKK